MSGSANRLNLAQEPDFDLGPLRVQPSIGRARAGDAEHRVEAQTLAVLILLVRAAGATVSREDLVNVCWQGRIVSDDAIARAIAKVRALARVTTPPAFTLETVPKVGYRLAPAAAAITDSEALVPPALPATRWRAAAFAVVAAIAVGAFLWTAAPRASQADLRTGVAPHAPEVADALLNLDEGRLGLYVRQGWSPNWLLDSEGNAALHTLMLVCERNPTHDQARLTRVARQLVEAGANPSTANGWGDTPLTIASAPRYCGPDHPVVAYLRTAADVSEAQQGGPAR